MSEEQLSLVQTRVPGPVLKWIERQAKGQSIASWLRIMLTELSKNDAPGEKLGDELRAIAKRLRNNPRQLAVAKLAAEFAAALERLAEHHSKSE